MFSEITNLAKEAALKAGSILSKGFGSSFEINNKIGKNNLVTEFDYLAEKAIIDLIKSKFPSHQFLAEESGDTGISSDYLWVIDPLDGTVNFAHSVPIFSVSIACLFKGELISGVVYQPMQNELFIAEKDKGAYLNNKRIYVSITDDFLSSYLVTGFPYNINENPDNCLKHFVDIIQNGIPVRRLGSAALDLAYVAAGRFDAFWEIALNPWDVAAGMLLVKEAGGLITQYDKSIYSIWDKSLIASNGIIHNEISDILTNKKSL
ncbi:MAG: inositol monophosphatase family protein [Candidatus Kapabacteria bacterium]|nr:inositol monophosphatase family protein [Candidatus Kapabacteria bacterium]